jgi:hypothetical protein
MDRRPAPPDTPLPPDAGRRDALRVLAALAPLLALPRTATAGAGAELRIVSSPAADASAGIAAALARRFPGAPASDDVHALTARGGPGIYLAVGPAALQSALEADVPGTLVSAFVSSVAFQRLRGAIGRTRPLAAVYAEASPAAQMQLIRRLYRHRVTVGVLLGPATRHLQPLIEKAAAGADLAVACVEVKPGESPVRALAAITAASVLLALPDPDLYNALDARAILESTYRRRQGVIGFSKAMVGAGTLGAAYATVDDVVAHLGDMVDALLAGQAVEAQYPLYWRVAINETVARSLDVVVDASARGLGNFPA